MNFIKTNNSETICKLRSNLYENLVSPIDAMWEQLYIGSSQHYLIDTDTRTLGYCCITSEKCLVQIFLLKEFNGIMDKVLLALIDLELIASASLSSSEPIAFNTCLLLSKSIKANTLCFEHHNKLIDVDSQLNLELVTSDEIPIVKEFLKEQVGLDDTFGYTENLVSRREIFLVRGTDEIVATSECRISDSQKEFADIGIIVNKDYQGQGIATRVMQMQVNSLLKVKRKPICSTTLDNVASRKAIEKSGFYCTNIIYDISLCELSNVGHFNTFNSIF